MCAKSRVVAKSGVAAACVWYVGAIGTLDQMRTNAMKYEKYLDDATVNALHRAIDAAQSALTSSPLKVK